MEQTVLIKRKVGWSMLQYDLTIPLAEQQIYEAITNTTLSVGSRHNIKLIIDGQMYNAYFRNEGFNRQRFSRTDIMMLSYGMDVKRKLQSIFSDTYNKMLEIRADLGPNARMPEIEDSNEYIVVSSTSNPDVFSMDCITNKDNVDVNEYLKNVQEEAFENDTFINRTDPTASLQVSNAVQKIRHLDRSIGDSLKRLYDFRCQMTGERIGDGYGALVVEAHHIVPFTESLNNDTSNIIILSPSYHRIIHKAKPTWDADNLSFCFPNGLVEKVKVNKHLGV